jgi:hypothetical protein
MKILMCVIVSCYLWVKHGIDCVKATFMRALKDAPQENDPLRRPGPTPVERLRVHWTHGQ